jgi:glycosyltransferase involved in cell wall biosynthesis
MKILFISRYVDPNVGQLKHVFLPAKSLKEDFGLDVEILTWPQSDPWTGIVPTKMLQVPPLKVIREGLAYHVFTAPSDWDAISGGNVISDAAWEAAVNFGMDVLKSLQPDIVHLHHRHGLWWLLDSAQRLGIPTVYSSYDWGIGCLRTFLVMGDNSLCDGVVEPNKCAQCITTGRGVVGKINEALVEAPWGETFVEFLAKTPLKQELDKRGLVRQSALKRATTNYARATNVLSKLRHCFTPSHFGKQFFTQLGVQSDRVTVLPWYHDPMNVKKTVTADQPFTITYLGRVSPEKGVHLICKALEALTNVEPLVLRITGTNDLAYCTALRTKYPDRIGIHEVQWLGWSEVEALLNSTDVTIIPSIWMDNTPFVMLEALSHQVPVIGSRIPPIAELIKEGNNGFLADYRSVESLTDAIRRAIAKKVQIRDGSMMFEPVLSSKDYLAHFVKAYYHIAQV